MSNLFILDNNINKQPKKNDAVKIFFSYLAVYLVAFSISTTVVFYIGISLLFTLIYQAGDAKVPLVSAIKFVFTITPFVLIPTPLAALLMTSVKFIRNKELHKPYQLSNGLLPLYYVQKILIKTSLAYTEIYSLCTLSLESLENSEFIIIKDDPIAGVIKAFVRNNKKDIRGETVDFKFRIIDVDKIEIKIFSYSNVWIKGIDGAINIKNISDIGIFLKNKIAADKIEVYVCQD